MGRCRICGASGLFLLTDRDGACHRCGEIAAAGDPRDVQEDVTNAKLRRGQTAFGDRYVLHVRHGRLPRFAARPIEVHRWDAALWLYPRTVTTRVNFIPVYTRWLAVMHFRTGVLEVESRGEEDGQFVLAFASSRAPWAFVGYSHATEEAASLDPRELRARVEVRRTQLLNDHATGEWRPPWPVPGLEPFHPGFT